VQQLELKIRQTSAFFVLLTALVIGLSATFIYLLSVADFIGLRTAFVLLTLLLLIYFALEVNRVRLLHPVRWLMNPVVLCSLMTFVLYFGVTNLLYFLPEDFVALIDVRPEVTPLMNKLMLLVVIGAVAMWLGYWSPLAARLTVKGPLVKFHNLFFKVKAAPNAWVLPVLILISLASRLIQVRLGVFGYSSNYERLIEAASYTQYLSMAGSLGKLALVVATFNYYSPHLRRQARIWFFGILAYEILFGFLSGFKSAVVFPFIIVLLCHYLRVGRVSRYWLIAIPLGIMVAYAVIEPFRLMRNNNADIDTSLISIVNTMATSTLSEVVEVESDHDFGPVYTEAPVLLNMMNRFNLTSVGSLGISFADDYENQSAASEPFSVESPKFIWDIILAPLHAWIPRFLWGEGKSLGNTGLWYTQAVVNPISGHEVYSSTAMGIFTNLYFAGGTIAIFCGFFFIGFINRLLFFITQPWISDAGGIVFMSMLTTTAIIAEVPFNGIIVSIFRQLPLVLIMMVFFYKPMRRVV
jgi:hypothetical protein